ncbi:heparinase II/III family protein [Rhizobiaceae bacterium n13]|uniref:Heparinase II/III family protein n=1 Tax=Ferirhizobium litorale TaxID=2927786 RepID=A0AAE3QGU2_9HYPH|nr:heparinase II/III family protein [Fererhizobium litorale]MDI7863068.1 heparinase II/III family protein [Fererhizobium litorale]MDI7923255.1 heparinase II/III family protein [Fererhizobium litorale]
MQLSDRNRLCYFYVREAVQRFSRSVSSGRHSLLRMSRRAPDRLIVAPTDLRAIDPFVAEEIMEGRFPLAGRVLETEGSSPFSLELPSKVFAAHLHSFRWLRHLRAERTEAACVRARTIIDQWIRLHGRRTTGIAWDADVSAQRLIAFLSHSPIVLHSTEGGFYRRFMKSIAFHVRHLRRIAGHAPDGEIRFRIRIALAIASVAMPVRLSAVKRAGRDLDREIDRQILGDGGHVSRNPRTALDLLLDLLPLRQTYVNLGHDVPAKLIPGIDRMYPALRFFRHQGGDLALFNGATPALANELMSVLRYDETAGQPFKALPHTNYHRLQSGNAVVIVDTGHALSTDLSKTAHAGCLSFEMSSGKHRFIVNAGSPKYAGNKIRQLARATAAHSTVTLNETSSCRFSQSPFVGPIIVSGVTRVDFKRQELADGSDGLLAVHDGYKPIFGVLHEREIRMNVGGTRVSGRDRIFRPDGADLGADNEDVAIARFHVHPAIDMVQADRDSVLLTAPDGETWIFTAFGLDVVISEDVFFADASGVRHSEQLEVTFPLATRPEIRWEFARRK